MLFVFFNSVHVTFLQLEKLRLFSFLKDYFGYPDLPQGSLPCFLHDVLFMFFSFELARAPSAEPVSPSLLTFTFSNKKVTHTIKIILTKTSQRLSMSHPGSQNEKGSLIYPLTLGNDSLSIVKQQEVSSYKDSARI